MFTPVRTSSLLARLLQPSLRFVSPASEAFQLSVPYRATSCRCAFHCEVEARPEIARAKEELSREDRIELAVRQYRAKQHTGPQDPEADPEADHDAPYFQEADLSKFQDDRFSGLLS